MLAHLEVRATQAANSCISKLYRSGVFIPPERARSIAELGLSFLACYQKLASMAFHRKMRRYTLLPKLHFWNHLMVDLLESSARNSWTLSPMIYSVQLQEDYIGKPSRISRRVSPKTQPLRTLQRLLLSMFAEFHKLEKRA